MSENKPLLDGFLIFSLVFVIILILTITHIVFGESNVVPTVVANEEYIWTEDDEIGRLIREAELPIVPEKTNVDILHARICQTTSKSLLCEDIEILRRIDTIGKEKGVPAGLIVGIMFAESTLGINYNKPACSHYNNPYGIKGRKYDTGKVEWYTKTKGRADSNGCWLYKFNSIDEATYSLANTISMGYKSCKNNVRCISFAYVGDPNVAEQSWIDRVNKFAQIR